MATTFVSGYLKTYAADAWTDILVAPAGKTLVVKHYMMMNTTGSTIDVSMRIVDDGDVELAIQVNAYVLDFDKPLNCTGAFIVLKDGDTLQVKASATGVHFSAWGGYD